MSVCNLHPIFALKIICGVSTKTVQATNPAFCATTVVLLLSEFDQLVAASAAADCARCNNSNI